MARDIQLKLVLDDKGFVTQVSGAINSAEKLKKILGSPAPKINTGSIEDLRRRVDAARASMEKAAPASREFENALKRLQVASGHLDDAQVRVAGKMQNELVPSTNQANYAMMNLTRVVSDAPYGFMGIANNIDPLVQSFMALKSTAGGASGALSAMGAALSGPAGLMIAISAVTSLLLVLPDLFSDSTEEISKQKEEVDKLSRSYDLLTEAQIQEYVLKKKKELAEIQTKRSDKTMSAEAYSKAADQIVADVFNVTGNLEYLAGLWWQTADIVGNTVLDVVNPGRNYAKERERQLENELTALDVAKKKLSEITELENRIAVNRKKNKELTEENFKDFVPDADNKDQARAMIQSWLEADQKKLDVLSGKNKKYREKEASEEIKRQKLLYQLNEKSLSEYKSYLEDKLALIKGSGLKELALRQELLDELSALNITQEARKKADVTSRKLSPLAVDYDKIATLDEKKFKKKVKETLPESWNKYTSMNSPEMSADTRREKEQNEIISEKDTLAYKERVNTVKTLFTELGNSIANSLIKGKLAIQDLIKDLGALVLQLAITKLVSFGVDAGLKAIGLGDIVSSPGGGSGEGASVTPPTAENFRAVGGGLSGPAATTGVRQPQQLKQQVEVVGNIRANASEFYVELQKLNARMDSITRVANVGRA